MNPGFNGKLSKQEVETRYGGVATQLEKTSKNFLVEARECSHVDSPNGKSR